MLGWDSRVFSVYLPHATLTLILMDIKIMHDNFGIIVHEVRQDF